MKSKAKIDFSDFNRNVEKYRNIKLSIFFLHAQKFAILGTVSLIKYPDIKHMLNLYRYTTITY